MGNPYFVILEFVENPHFVIFEIVEKSFLSTINTNADTPDIQIRYVCVLLYIFLFTVGKLEKMLYNKTINFYKEDKL